MAAFDVSINAAKDVSSDASRVVYAPEALGFTGHVTVDDNYLSRDGTSLTKMTDIISGGEFTANGDTAIQYNAASGFASGVPSITLERAENQYLQETTGNLKNIPDNFGRFTVYMIARFVSTTAGTTWSSGTTDDRLRVYMNAGVHSAYRDNGPGATVTPGSSLNTATDYWLCSGYSGRDSQLWTKGFNRIEGYSDRSVSVATDLRIGEDIGGGNHGDLEIIDWCIAPFWLNDAGHATMQAWADQRIALGTHMTVAGPTADAFYTAHFGQSNGVNKYVWGFEEMGNLCVNGAGTDEFQKGGAYYEAIKDDILANASPSKPLYFYVSNGEDEAQTVPRAALYQSEMETIISDMESDLSAYTVTWIFELLHASGTRPETATVRAAQDAIVAADANVFGSNHDDLTLSDGVHYQTADLNARRRRMDGIRDGDPWPVIAADYSSDVNEWWDWTADYISTDTGIDVVTGRLSGLTLVQAVGGNQPAWNEAGNFGSGMPSASFTAASTQSVSGAATLAAAIDNGQASTICGCMRLPSLAVGNAGLFGADSASNILTGLWVTPAGSLRYRYRDAAGNFQVIGAGTATVNTDAFYILTYDGNDTIRIHTTFGAEVTATGAAAKTMIANVFKLGQMAGLGFGDIEMGHLVVLDRDIGADGTVEHDAAEAWLIAEMAA